MNLLIYSSKKTNSTTMKKLLVLLLSFIATTAFAQINTSDSTVQVISYWNLGETQSYAISLQKIQMNGDDTTKNELITYDVDIKVLDSTENSYVIEWYYHNYQSNSTNEIEKKAISVAENLKVEIETDEYGAIRGVRNWEEVSAYIKKGIAQITSNYEMSPQKQELLAQTELKYTTKEAIESNGIDDVLQFHLFHGIKYQKGEVLEVPLKLVNNYNPNKPFDVKSTTSLEEIYPEDAYYILKCTQEVDSKQLANATYEYLKSMYKTIGWQKIKKREISRLSNVTQTVSGIHNTGWVLYSINTVTVEAQGIKDIEKRTIELQ